MANPVLYIDPDGTSTWVMRNADGTYRVVGGNLNDKDRNIYVYSIKDGNIVRGESIGITTSTTSFYNSDANEGKGAWVIGSIIDPNDKSGDKFLGNLFGNTPPMFNDYMANAGNNQKYDFKSTNGGNAPVENIKHYRGMPIGETRNGLTIYTSGRDVGNIAAGYISGANGMPWTASRIAFDAYQSKVSGRPTMEGLSTRNAEKYGWRIGVNIAPTLKSTNLLESITNGLKSIWK